jgi:hypothetical protein
MKTKKIFNHDRTRSIIIDDDGQQRMMVRRKPTVI